MSGSEITTHASAMSSKLMPQSTDRTYGVNVLSHFWTIQAFLPAMIAKGSGHIVTVSSVLGMMGCAQMSESSHGIEVD